MLLQFFYNLAIVKPSLDVLNLYIKYIYIFLLFSSHLYSQKKDTIIWFPPHIPTDSIHGIIENNFLLNNHLIPVDSKIKLESFKPNDTLYIYVHLNDEIIVNEKANHKDLSIKMKEINESLINNSYVYSKLIPEKIKINREKLSIYYRLKNANSILIDSIIVKPDEVCPPNLKKIISKKYKNQKITKQNIKKISRFISQNTHSAPIKKPYMLIDKKRHYLQYEFKKNQTNYLSGLLGFYNNQNRKLILEGEIKTGFFNLLNIGEEFLFSWQKKDQYQDLHFNINLPYITGKNFSIMNKFHSNRNDTISSLLNNQTAVRWKWNKHRLYLNYTYEEIQEKVKSSIHQYLGTGYGYEQNLYDDFYARNFSIEYYTYKFEKNIFYSGLNNFTKIKKWAWKQQWQFLSNNTGNKIDYQNISTNFFRKNVVSINTLKNIISLKNEFVFDQKKLKIYLIGDYLTGKTLTNKKFSYANLGIGVNIFKKNQKLILELIKNFKDSYLTDYQSIYFNIKQKIKF